MKIIIMVKPNCDGCEKVKKYLDNINLDYEAIDATKNLDILYKFPIVMAPGIVVDDKLVFSGTPSEKELDEIFK